MRTNEMTRIEETQDGVTRVNGRGLKHLTDQLRGEMEKEIANQKDLGKKILDHGLAEHSPGWVEWWVLARKEEKPAAPSKEGKMAVAQAEKFISRPRA